MSAPKPLCAGNWKMNGLSHSINEIEALKDHLSSADFTSNCDVLLCPPVTLLMGFSHITKDESIDLGAQDCHANDSGAHTGDVSAAMIKDCGASFVIVGHSERRMDHKETNDLVKNKAQAAIDHGLTAIICVGELESERKSGKTLKIIEDQVKGSLPDGDVAGDIVIAYEPVWAIGTGLVPTTDDVAEVHKFIRDLLGKRFGDDGDQIRILYGGSVKPSNAKELMAVENVDGALVGGASLKAKDFIGIISAFKS